MPAGGAGAAGAPQRSATQSRRGREGSDIHGSGMSPKAKRAGTRNDPTVQQGLVLSAEDLSAAVYTLNARMDAAQQWIDTIATGVDDHANQLEATACEIIVARATLTEFRAFVQEG